MDSNLIPKPEVTVLMPVFNGEAFLRPAIASILSQTFPDFELLIINDGSTDGTAKIARSFSDRRIRYIENDDNLGLIHTLNRGLEMARGIYVARMDCDDVSLPRRLEYQVSFMDANPEIGVCGTWYREIRGKITTIMRCAEDHASIHCGTLFNPVVGHPTVMLRKPLLDQHRLRYDATFPHAEDYRLWADCLDFIMFANIPTVLMDYRIHPLQVTQSRLDDQMASSGRVRLSLLRRMGLEPTNEEFEIHQYISALGRPYCNSFVNLPVAEQLVKVDGWLCQLKSANDSLKIFPEPAFSRILVERWLGVVFWHYVLKGKISPGMVKSPSLFKKIHDGGDISLKFMMRRTGYLVSDILDNLRLQW